MTPITTGLIAIGAFLVLMCLGLPLGFSFLLVGFTGIALRQGLVPALSLLGEVPYTWTASYSLASIPLFVLMGEFVYFSGIGKQLFSSAYKWTANLPGGVAIATILACAGFSSCCGSSTACAATMGTVAFPEMDRIKYSPRLSTSVLAAGGTLGILIPPSNVFITYGVITETSIGALFIAGILPGIMLTVMFCLVIFLMCKRNPQLGPPGEASSWREKFASLTGIWGAVALFILVIGGLYFGVFAPSEAGTIGAIGAFLIAAVIRRAPKSSIFDSLRETVLIACYILFIIIGAMTFNVFLAITGMPSALSTWVTSLPFSPIVFVIVILIMYIPLGMFLDAMSVTLLTVPIIFPVIVRLGFDPVWWGVLMVLETELAIITPPVALNIFVIQGVTKVPMEEIARGIIPFVITIALAMVILVAFPQISLYLPSMMKY